MLYITDRLGNKFPVKNYCKYCYNIIYNSAPIVLWIRKMKSGAWNHLESSEFYIRKRTGRMEQILESYKMFFWRIKRYRCQISVLPEDILSGGSKVGEKLVNIIVELSKYLMIILMTSLHILVFQYFWISRSG